MAAHLIVQASAAMFETAQPQGWTHVFGVYVTDQDGRPVEGLKKKNFSVWRLTNNSELTINIAMEFNAEFPTSKMPGIYRLQTSVVLFSQAPHPQHFVFAIRVSSSGRESVDGITTVPLTYLGKAH